MISLLFNMLVKGNLKASLVTRPYSKPIRRLIEVVERDMTIYAVESFDVSFRTKADFFQTTESQMFFLPAGPTLKNIMCGR